MTRKLKIFIGSLILGLALYFSILEQLPDWSPRTWIMVHGKSIRYSIDILENYHFRNLATKRSVSIFETDYFRATFNQMDLEEKKRIGQFRQQFPDLIIDPNGYYYLPLKGFMSKPFGLVFRGYRTSNDEPKVNQPVEINSYTELFGDWYYYKVK